MASKWAGNMRGKFPGEAEVWYNATHDSYWLAYRIPTNGRWMLYWLNADEYKSIVGDTHPSLRPRNPAGAPDRIFNDNDARNWGIVWGGGAGGLMNKADHPFQAMVDDWGKLARTQPWLKDPEVLAIHVDAMLEGRGQPSIDDWANTNYWRTKTEAERDWIRLMAQDPATATQKFTDARLITRNAMIAEGIRDPDAALVAVLAAGLTGGQWSKEYWETQIKYLADPYARPRPGDESLDKDVRAILRTLGAKVDTTQKGLDKVEDTINRTLGPAFSAGWTQAHKEYWAGQIRNDPDAEQTLASTLKRQFATLFPAYKDNPDADYETVAAPWRSFVSSVWGQDPDETDPIFLKVLQANDAAYAGEQLRAEGLRRGIGKVVTDATDAIGQQFGYGVIPTGGR